MWFTPLHAQQYFGEDSKLNTNLGASMINPLNPSAQFLSIGWGLVAGAGYNFNRRNSVIGEIMWNRIYPTDGSLSAIQTFQGSTISAHTQMFILTGNYRYELRGKKLGVYLIGGGGWYYRYSALNREITTSTGTTCEPSWLWWGFSCTSGTVTAGQTLKSSNSSAFGGNGGVGFTIRAGEAPYRVYFESRYHYAPNKDISTQLIVTTFGVRF
jgi:hypothetical protein